MYVARDGFYKIGDGNFHDQLIPNQPQKKSSIKWHWVLRGGSIYKMGSTKWCGPTPPTLKTRWIPILFCARPHPFCRGNWRGDENNGKPPKKMDDLGDFTHYFCRNIHIVPGKWYTTNPTPPPTAPRPAWTFESWPEVFTTPSTTQLAIENQVGKNRLKTPGRSTSQMLNGTGIFSYIWPKSLYMVIYIWYMNVGKSARAIEHLGIEPW